MVTERRRAQRRPENVAERSEQSKLERVRWNNGEGLGDTLSDADPDLEELVKVEQQEP